MYYLTSFLVPIILISGVFGFADQKWVCPTALIENSIRRCNGHKDIKKVQQFFNMILIILFTMFSFVAFYSIILAFKRLSRTGVNANSRKNFIVKHASYIFVMIAAWTVQLFLNYEQLFNAINL